MLLSMLCLWIGFSPAHAADYHSAKTAALAGSGHALPSLVDQIYLNPASTSFAKTYNIHVGFSRFHGPEETEPKGRNFALAVLDGRNDWFQAGVGYVQRRDGNLLHIGASKSLLETLGVGIGGKRGWASQGRPNMEETSVSAVYEVLPGSAISLIADNVLGTRSGKAWGLKRELILGMRISYGNIISLNLDPHLIPELPGTGFGYQAGAELQIFSDVFFRIGKSKQSMQPHLAQYGRSYGWGFGWMAPRIELDFAVERTLAPIMTSQTFLSGTILY